MVELLTVIIIIGVLAGMLLPSLLRARERAREAVCRENLRKIGQGCQQYSHDFGDYYPHFWTSDTPSNPLKSLALLFDGYISIRDNFRCPSTSDSCADLMPGDTFLPHGQPEKSAGPRSVGGHRECSYGYDDMKGRMTDPGVAIAADAKPAPGDMVGSIDVGGAGNTGKAGLSVHNSANHRFYGQNVCFYDGHVTWFTSNYCGLDGDDIYNPMSASSLGETDSYIHQTDTQ